MSALDEVVVMLYPPTQHERIKNELMDDAQIALKKHFKTVFGRWPGNN